MLFGNLNEPDSYLYIHQMAIIGNMRLSGSDKYDSRVNNAVLVGYLAFATYIIMNDTYINVDL